MGAPLTDTLEETLASPRSLFTAYTPHHELAPATISILKSQTAGYEKQVMNESLKTCIGIGHLKRSQLFDFGG